MSSRNRVVNDYHNAVLKMRSQQALLGLWVRCLFLPWHFVLHEHFIVGIRAARE